MRKITLTFDRTVTKVEKAVVETTVSDEVWAFMQRDPDGFRAGVIYSLPFQAPPFEPVSEEMQVNVAWEDGGEP